MDRIPPTQNALLQHTRRAVYQVEIWTSSTQVQSWQPVWMTIPEVSKACSELIKCSCKETVQTASVEKLILHAHHRATVNVITTLKERL